MAASRRTLPSNHTAQAKALSAHSQSQKTLPTPLHPWPFWLKLIAARDLVIVMLRWAAQRVTGHSYEVALNQLVAVCLNLFSWLHGHSPVRLIPLPAPPKNFQRQSRGHRRSWWFGQVERHRSWRASHGWVEHAALLSAAFHT